MVHGYCGSAPALSGASQSQPLENLQSVRASLQPVCMLVGECCQTVTSYRIISQFRANIINCRYKIVTREEGNCIPVPEK